MITTATTLVLTIEYHMLLSILSTSWVELPPPVLESVVVEGLVVIIVFGVVVGVIGGTFSSIFVAAPVLNYTNVSQKSILKKEEDLKN